MAWNIDAKGSLMLLSMGSTISTATTAAAADAAANQRLV